MKVDYGFYNVRTNQGIELFCQVNIDTGNGIHRVACNSEDLEMLIERLNRARKTMELVIKEEGA